MPDSVDSIADLPRKLNDALRLATEAAHEAGAQALAKLLEAGAQPRPLTPFRVGAAQAQPNVLAPHQPLVEAFKPLVESTPLVQAKPLVEAQPLVQPPATPLTPRGLWKPTPSQALAISQAAAKAFEETMRRALQA